MRVCRAGRSRTIALPHGVAERSGRVRLQPELAVRQEVRPGLQRSGRDGVPPVVAAEGGQVARVRCLRQIDLSRVAVVVHVVRHHQHVVRPRRVRDHGGLGVGGARAGGDLLARAVVHVQVEVVGGVLPLDGDRHPALGVVRPIPLGDLDVHVESVADLAVGVLGGRWAGLGAARGALGVDRALPGDALVGGVEDGTRRGRRESRSRGRAEQGDGQSGGQPRHGPGTVSESSHGTYLHSTDANQVLHRPQQADARSCLNSRHSAQLRA